jgi:hypothetical protein
MAASKLRRSFRRNYSSSKVHERIGVDYFDNSPLTNITVRRVDAIAK